MCWEMKQSAAAGGTAQCSATPATPATRRGLFMWLFSRFPRGRKKESDRAAASERARSAHFNYGAEGGTKKGKITTHGMMDLLRSLHLA